MFSAVTHKHRKALIAVWFPLKEEDRHSIYKPKVGKARPDISRYKK